MGNGIYEGQDQAVRGSRKSAILIQTLIEYIQASAAVPGLPEPEIERLTNLRNVALSWHNLLFTDEMQQEAERLAGLLQEKTGDGIDEATEGERISSSWSAYLFELFEADLMRTVARTALAARMGYEAVLCFGWAHDDKLSPYTVHEKVFASWKPLFKNLIGRANPETGRPYDRFMVTNEFHVYYFDELKVSH